METKSTKTKKRRFKKRYILLFLIVCLILFRILLPTLLKNYVNKTLANIPGYYGQVADIDIALYRGAYVIKGLYLNKVNAKTQVPFLDFPKTDISIEWRALFKGKIVSEIIMYSPQLTYVFEDQKTTSSEGTPDVEDWTKALTDIVPIDINNFEVYDGKLGFVQLQTDPNIDLYMDQLRLSATNLRNVKELGQKLPSPLTANAVSVGQGNFKLDGALNLFKQIPDMDLDFSLENADVTAFNELTRHYAGIDFKKGNAAIYGEIAIADGFLKGYVKPMLSDSQMISKEDGILGVIWEGFVGLFKFILKNHSNNTLATKVPLEGDLNNVEAGVWPTVIHIFENAWIQAFKGEIDDDIQFKDAYTEEEWSRMSSEEKRELRKEERQKRREERQKEKEANEDN